MNEPFVPSGVISLTTDFGHRGAFIGTMKAVMLSRFPGAQIVDLTHETLVYWPDEAGFWIARSYRYFPRGSVHVAVVDPGVGTRRDIIVMQREGHVFLAPDNGLLGALADGADCWQLEPAAMRRLGIGEPSATFHGRDIFAPVAAEIAAGRCAPDTLGPRVEAIVPGWLEEPQVSAGEVRGVVLTSDSFGNLITNIDGALIGKLRAPVILAAGRSLPLRRTYGDVQPGEFLALINSFGVLEIACAEQSAATLLEIGRGAPVVVRAGASTPAS